MDEINWMP